MLKQPISLLVNRDTNGYASGTVLLDGGISRKEMIEKKFEYHSIKVQVNSIQFQMLEGTRGTQDTILSEIKILNAKDLKDVTFACYYNRELQIKPLKFAYLDLELALQIEAADASDVLKFNQVLNIYYGGAKDVNLCVQESFQYMTAEKIDIEGKKEISV